MNLHTTTFAGGIVRSQMFPIGNTVAQVAGGAEWSTQITIRNSSSTAAVQGIVDFFQSNGSLMPEAITDPNIAFLIPPSGSVTFSTHNKGTFVGGYARVFSNGDVTVESRYLHPQWLWFTRFSTAAEAATTVTSRSVSLPVSFFSVIQVLPVIPLIPPTFSTAVTGVALVAHSEGTLTLSLVDLAGGIPGGSRTLDVTAGQHIALFINQLLPSLPTFVMGATLTITASAGPISVMALEFFSSEGGSRGSRVQLLSPVTVTALP